MLPEKRQSVCVWVRVYTAREEPSVPPRFAEVPFGAPKIFWLRISEHVEIEKKSNKIRTRIPSSERISGC